MTEPSPAAKPSGTYIPLVTDAVRLVRALISPGEVFGEQQEKPSWLMPWLVISIGAVILTVVQMPYNVRIMEISMQARAAASGNAAAAIPPAAMQIGKIISLVSIPLALLIFGLIGSLVMWIVLMLSGDKVRFRGLMTATVYSQTTALLGMIAGSVVLRLRGTPAEAIRTMQDARPSLGLDLLLGEGTSGFVRGLAAGIGPLQIWGLIIVVVGIQVLEKQKKGSAWTAALVSYLLALVLAAMFAGMGG